MTPDVVPPISVQEYTVLGLLVSTLAGVGIFLRSYIPARDAAFAATLAAERDLWSRHCDRLCDTFTANLTRACDTFERALDQIRKVPPNG